MENDMEEKRKHGGRRAGAGRPFSGRNCTLNVRISEEAFRKLSNIKNKSEFVDSLIKQTL